MEYLEHLVNLILAGNNNPQNLLPLEGGRSCIVLRIGGQQGGRYVAIDRDDNIAQLAVALARATDRDVMVSKGSLYPSGAKAGRWADDRIGATHGHEAAWRWAD